MTKAEVKDYIRGKMAEAAQHQDEDRAFSEGVDMFPELRSRGCDPDTYWTALLELIDEEKAKN